LDVVGGVRPGGREVLGGTLSGPVCPASLIPVPVSLLGACGSVEAADEDEEEEGDEEFEDGGLLVLRESGAPCCCCRRRWWARWPGGVPNAEPHAKWPKPE